MSIPFIDFIREDKSRYPYAASNGFIDVDRDFLIGDSGGILMNWNFKFVNTNLLTKVANYYKMHGNYCPYLPGTENYKKFWGREGMRRREGMTIKGKLLFKDIPYYESRTKQNEKDAILEDLHITGDHYNYLNYGRIMRTPTADERIELDRAGKFKQKLIDGFPRFWDGDYWNFKIDEFISINNFHLCKAKARGKGYSYKRGSQAANTINMIPKAVVILAAYDLSYLTDPSATSNMAKINLDWYEEQTYWKRGYLSEDIEAIQLGYKKRKSGSKKFGWLSTLLSVTCRNNTSCAIGKRALEIDLEEAGKCPNLQEFLDVTFSSTEVGAGGVGTIRVYGTAGIKDADWTSFSRTFYNPNANGMLPMENVWDKDARSSTCGFFHPQVLNYEPFMDIDGNSQFEEALAYDLDRKEFARKNKPLSEYITYVGQRANSPSEAFLSGSENIFSSPDLDIHINNLMNGSELNFFRDGMIVEEPTGVKFYTHQQMKDQGYTTHPYIDDVPFKPGSDLHGCIREFYPPFTVNGIIPDNLYYAVYDTIGKDKDTKEVTSKNSLACIQIWMYPNDISNSSGDIEVASYVGRPNTMEEVDRIFYKLMLRYNCKGLPEVDRGETVSNFRKWNKLNMLYKDPTTIIDEKISPNARANYGIVIGEGDKAVDGLIYLKDFLYQIVGNDSETGRTLYNFHYVRDLPFLLELKKFNGTGNFDRVSTARVMTFQRMAYRTLRRKASVKKTEGTMMQRINLYGYYN